MPFEDRTLRSRFELKYWLNPAQEQRVRLAIQPFVQPDRFARTCPGYRYQISSLYLDTPGLDLYRTTIEGHKNRYKLRVRTYDDHPESPAFFEIKRRVSQVVKKVRARITKEAALAFLRGETIPEDAGSEGTMEFVRTARTIRAAPLMRVKYSREAYESSGRDPVRITFDSAVQHKVTRHADLTLGGDGWRRTPLKGVILEVKFTDCYPGWIEALIRQLDLERNSIPKYVLSLERDITRSAVGERVFHARTQPEHLDSDVSA